MGSLGPRLTIAPKASLELKVAPGLLQLVNILQLNRLELKEMLNHELEINPVLEEATEAAASEELTAEELLPLLEQEHENDPADRELLDALQNEAALHRAEFEGIDAEASEAQPDYLKAAGSDESPVPDSVGDMDMPAFSSGAIEPGHKSPASEVIEKPSYESFVSAPVTLADHLTQQLSMLPISGEVHDAADTIIGNLDEIGYLQLPLEEVAELGMHDLPTVEEALETVQSLEPAGIAARSVQECLRLQIKSRNGAGGVAWQIVESHMKLLETKQLRQLGKVLRRPSEHIEIAMHAILTLDPRPGARFSVPGAEHVVPDVYIFRDGAQYVIQLNDEELPQLRLNAGYKNMLDRGQNPDRETRHFIKERYLSALQLIKNIEQRRQTILRVCECVVQRQQEFLEDGIDCLRPMMIKEIAEEIGVHPSTVSRAVSSKYAHTPQGVYELRFFFSEAVQGPQGAELPLVILKRKVKKMIEEEDTRSPWTDDQITRMLNEEGIHVTRRTVAKYREDMKIPSTHYRRVRD